VLINKVVEWSINRVTGESGRCSRRVFRLKDRFVDSLKQGFFRDIERLVPVPYLSQAIDVRANLAPLWIQSSCKGEPGVWASPQRSPRFEPNGRTLRSSISASFQTNIPRHPRMDADSFMRSLCIGLKKRVSRSRISRMYSELNKATLNAWLNFLSDQGKRVILRARWFGHVDLKHRQGLVEHPLTDAMTGCCHRGSS